MKEASARPSILKEDSGLDLRTPELLFIVESAETATSGTFLPGWRSQTVTLSVDEEFVMRRSAPGWDDACGRIELLMLEEEEDAEDEDWDLLWRIKESKSGWEIEEGVSDEDRDTGKDLKESVDEDAAESSSVS